MSNNFEFFRTRASSPTECMAQYYPIGSGVVKASHAECGEE
jgi:hypothetical protein